MCCSDSSYSFAQGIKKGFRCYLRPFAFIFGMKTSVLLFEEIKIVIEKIEPRCHVSV